MGAILAKWAISSIPCGRIIKTGSPFGMHLVI